MIKFQKGQIWWFDPDPVQGREQGKKIRPGLIISGNQFNNSRAGLVTIIPCTTQNKKIVSHILLEEKNSGLKKKCYAVCEQIRTIDKNRLKRNPIGFVNDETMKQVHHWIITILDIYL